MNIYVESTAICLVLFISRFRVCRSWHLKKLTVHHSATNQCANHSQSWLALQEDFSTRGTVNLHGKCNLQVHIDRDVSDL